MTIIEATVSGSIDEQRKHFEKMLKFTLILINYDEKEALKVED